MRFVSLLSIILFTIVNVYGQEIPDINWDSLQLTKPWEKTEVWNPVPTQVTPGMAMLAPSDAVVLFDGKSLDAWCKPQYIDEGVNMDQISAAIGLLDTDRDRQAADWNIQDGAIVVKPGTGAIETKQGFGDMQLHIEWLSPTDLQKKGQAYSNSGVFIMGMYEIQVLNSHSNTTYPNGQAGAIYKQHIPLVNASKPSGEWQTYDIIWTAPRFDSNGKMNSPAKMTALHNGVLIQNNVVLEGPTAYIGKSKYIAHPDKLPIRLQDHGDLVRFRNIWVREL